MNRTTVTTFGVAAALTGALAALGALVVTAAGANSAEAATQDLLPPVTITWTPRH